MASRHFRQRRRQSRSTLATNGAGTIGEYNASTGALINGSVISGLPGPTNIALVNTGNVVQGNYIGTDVTGTAALGNYNGVAVYSAGNTIGGTTAGAGNIISGNTGDGVLISGSTASGNVVEGNYIGTDYTGSVALGNDAGNVVIASDRTDNNGGVVIASGASGNTIGGDTAAARNIISGNIGDGIDITGSGANGNTVVGNYIGTDAAGNKLALSNGDNRRFRRRTNPLWSQTTIPSAALVS